VQQKHPAVKQGETGQEMAPEFCLSVSLSYLNGSLTCHKILWHGANGFTSPLKEVVLRTFTGLKNPLFLARFEPTNHGSNGKHNNHHTTKNVTSKTVTHDSNCAKIYFKIQWCQYSDCDCTSLNTASKLVKKICQISCS
jgi:hypothetical protein